MGSHGGNEIALLAKQRRTPLFIKFERCSQGARGAPRRHWGSDGASGPEEQPDSALITDDYKEQLSNDGLIRNVSTNVANEAIETATPARLERAANSFEGCCSIH